MGLKKFQNFRQKEEYKPHSSTACGVGAHRTRVQTVRTHLQRRREHLEFCEVIVRKTRRCHVITPFQSRITAALSITRHWTYEVNSPNICADFFLTDALEYLKSARSEKKKEKKKRVFLRKGLTIADLFEGLWSVGTRFRHWRHS